MRHLAALGLLLAEATALQFRGAGRALGAGHAPRVPTKRYDAPRMSYTLTGDKLLAKVDDAFTSRFVRVAHHASAAASLAAFGAVSTAMQMPKAAMPMPTLSGVITKRLGATSNTMFAQFFPTLVTPAGFVFLIWPAIAALQFGTLCVSVQRSLLTPTIVGGVKNKVLDRGPMNARELSSLALANVAATLWLFASSNARAGALPLGSALVLPFVPLFAGYPLRRANEPSALSKPVLRVFSSFTTVASVLALAVELQWGGRVPLLAGRAELCGVVFLSLVAGRANVAALVALPGRTLERRAVTSFALTGVVARRLAAGATLSPTLAGAVALLAWSLKKLAPVM